MRQDEVEYWDGQFGNEVFYENSYKRQAIVKNLLGMKLIGKSVFEIGAGCGVTANAVHSALVGNFTYTGCELSAKGAESIRDRFELDVRHGEITALPTSHKYDIVWAFDVLEHVKPEDRKQGYAEIGRVLKDQGVIVLNQPCGETHHDLNYDHGFGLRDLVELAEVSNTELKIFKEYSVEAHSGWLRYQWIVLQRVNK